MDAVEASYVGRMLAWMAMEGSGVTVEHWAGDVGPRWSVEWGHRLGRVHGTGPTLAEAVMDALRQTGARPP